MDVHVYKLFNVLHVYNDCIDVYEEIPLDPGPVEEKLLGSRWIGGDEGSKIHKVTPDHTHNVSLTTPTSYTIHTRLCILHV